MDNLQKAMLEIAQAQGYIKALEERDDINYDDISLIGDRLKKTVEFILAKNEDLDAEDIEKSIVKVVG